MCNKYVCMYFMHVYVYVSVYVTLAQSCTCMSLDGNYDVAEHTICNMCAVSPSSMHHDWIHYVKGTNLVFAHQLVRVLSKVGT